MRLRTIFFVFYLIILIKLLFFKITLNFSDISIAGNSHASFKRLLAASNFIPFYRIYYYASGQEPYLVGILNIVGNILLFVPMGFCLPYFFKSLQKAMTLSIAIAIMSLGIEVLQLLTTTGEFDVDDILLNTLGAVLGYSFYRRIQNLSAQKTHPAKAVQRPRF